MRLYVVCAFCITIVACACSVGSAKDIRTLEKSEPADPGIKHIYLDADIGVAELILTTHDDGDVYTAEVTYDAETTDAGIEYDEDGSSADLVLFSEKTDNDLDIDTDDTRWEISLSRDYTWDIRLDMGVTDADIDLSGLPVEGLRIDHGVSDCRIVFAEPNPIRMRRLVVDAGVGDLEIQGLGYANAEDMYFDGGTGDFELNFSGRMKGIHTAQIDVGVGSVTIELPRELAVRVESEEGWLNSVEVPKNHFDEIDDDVYETDGFERTGDALEIELDVGIGSATIELRD